MEMKKINLKSLSEDRLHMIATVAEEWGWQPLGLLGYLRDGGTRSEILNASAMQTAHEIIRVLAEKK
jgi:hypothetical protein